MYYCFMSNMFPQQFHNNLFFMNNKNNKTTITTTMATMMMITMIFQRQLIFNLKIEEKNI